MLKFNQVYRSPLRINRGAAAVELALLTLPLVLMAMAAVEFARGMYHYHILVKSTRDAARLLSAFDPTSITEYPTQLAINRTLYGQDTAGDLLLKDLTAQMVSICDRINSAGCPGGSFANVSTGTSSVNLVRVQINNYPFKPLFGAGIVPQITFGPIGTTMMAVR